MADQLFPTKGNLMKAKKTLDLAKSGFDLLDRKRNILVREMMSLINRAKTIQDEIKDRYSRAYLALQRANVAHGLCDTIAAAVPVETGLDLTFRSVMGVELPTLKLHERSLSVPYGFIDTSSLVDEAYILFEDAKRLTVELAEVETSVYRLADAVGKTQKRANALKNIIIPQYSTAIHNITEALEEKEREDFSRLKVIKAQKENS